MRTALPLLLLLAGCAPPPTTATRPPPPSPYLGAWTKDHRPPWVNHAGPAGVVVEKRAKLAAAEEIFEGLFRADALVSLSVQPNRLTVNRSAWYGARPEARRSILEAVVLWLDWKGFSVDLDVLTEDGASLGHWNIFALGGLPDAADQREKD